MDLLRLPLSLESVAQDKPPLAAGRLPFVRRRLLFLFCGISSSAMLWPTVEEARSYLTYGSPLGGGEKFFVMSTIAVSTPVIILSLAFVLSFTAWLWRDTHVRKRIMKWSCLFIGGCIDWPALGRLDIDPRAFADIVDATLLLVSVACALIWVVRPVRRPPMHSPHSE